MIFKNTLKIKWSLVEIQVFIDPSSHYSISVSHNGLRDKNLSNHASELQCFTCIPYHIP